MESERLFSGGGPVQGSSVWFGPAWLWRRGEACTDSEDVEMAGFPDAPGAGQEGRRGAKGGHQPRTQQQMTRDG